MRHIYLLFVACPLLATPVRGQSKGLDPHYFETGLWVCDGGGAAGSLDDDIAKGGNDVTLTRAAVDELAKNNKCLRIEADNIKPVSFGTVTSTDCSLRVRWGDGKRTAWVGIRSYLSYMQFHVVRKPT